MADSNFYSQQMMESIDTIIKDRLNEIKFDRTEICKIISKDKNDSTHYWVSNEAGLKYEAYTSDNKITYTTGTKVYVLIPQGNYDIRKTIIAKYSEEEKENNKLYTNPFDRLVVRNKIIINCNGFEVQADNEGREVTKGNNNNISPSGFGILDYFAIEFTATTGFGGDQGIFYLRPQFYDNEDTPLLTEEQQNLLTFSSQQIQGNPYYLTNQIKIQHLFYFPEEIEISKINKIRFTLLTNGKFNYSDSMEENIIINSLNCQFGYDIENENLEQDKIVLSLNNTDSLEYTTTVNIKELSIDWCDLKNKKIYNARDPRVSSQNYTIYWLQYALFDGYQKNDSTDIEQSGAYWKTIDTQKYLLTLTPNIDWPSEDIKVGIRKQENDTTTFYKESNVLHFTNTIYKVAPAEINRIKDTLTFTLEENDDGIYNEYGIDNKLIKRNQVHQITAHFTNGLEWENNYNYNKWKVVWQIPKNSSMLTIPQIIVYNDNGQAKSIDDPNWIEGTGEYTDYYIYNDTPKDCIKDNDKYYYIFDNTIKIYVDPNNISEIGEGQYKYYPCKTNTIFYGLNNQFNFTRTNNDIKCSVIIYLSDEDKSTGSINGIPYRGSFKFQFGTQGTSGTDYAFNIYANPNNTGLLTTGTNSITFTARLENELGQEINLNNQNVEWSYMYDTIGWKSIIPYVNINNRNGDHDGEVEIKIVRGDYESNNYHYLVGNFIIPEKVNGKPITKISGDVENKIDCTELSGLKIPTSVQEITKQAFGQINDNNNNPSYYTPTNLTLILEKRDEALTFSDENSTFLNNCDFTDPHGSKLTYLGSEGELETHIITPNHGKSIGGLEDYEEAYIYYLNIDDNNTCTINYNNLYTISPNYAILVATLKNFIDTTTQKPVNLKAYYPIPITLNKNYYITGASQIVYDYQGTNPNYDNEIYKLYERFEDDRDDQEITDIFWKIEPLNENDNLDNYPSLKDVKNSEIIGQTISPLSNMNTINNPCRVVAYRIVNDQKQELYSQPILTLQNTYAFSLLNTWDGSTYVGENEIMAQLIGAGTKNANNQYTGVLMGAVSEAGAEASTGIYGFQNGALRYKLDEHGSFYVGAENSNNNSDYYISFNENNGRSKNGELIIKASKFKVNTEQENINSFLINSEATGGDSVIEFKYFDQNNNERTGFKLSANGTGSIGFWNFNKDSLSYNDGEYYFGIPKTFDEKENIVLKLGNYFMIDTNGMSYLTSIGPTLTTYLVSQFGKGCLSFGSASDWHQGWLEEYTLNRNGVYYGTYQHASWADIIAAANNYAQNH